MKDAILIVLADRWASEAKPMDLGPTNEVEKIANAKAQGYRECKLECADALRALVDILGGRQKRI